MTNLQLSDVFVILFVILILTLIVNEAYRAKRNTEIRKINNSSQPSKFQFNNSNLKLGFCTSNFNQSMKLNVKNIKRLIDYAVKNGYYWLELRDPNASLSFGDCKQIADYAYGNNIDIIYAIDKGLLDKDFWDIYPKAIDNASIFYGPRVIRILGGNEEFKKNPFKKGWTKYEYSLVSTFASRAGKIASDYGLQLSIENTVEPLLGSYDSTGNIYHGFRDLMSNTNKNVNWVFDTSNLFTISREPVTPFKAYEYLKDNIRRVSYIQLKSSSGDAVQSVLTVNELSFDKILNTASANDITYIAMELPPQHTFKQIDNNMNSSLDYLVQNEF
jgi:sugar phosphate isomerase/epimerase